MRTFIAAVLALAVAVPSTTLGDPQSGARLQVAESPQYGPYLTDAEGNALYLFTADEQGGAGRAAASACYDNCARAWPPLLASEAAPTVSGEQIDPKLLGVTERQDGLKQVTYNGWPLYTFVKDQAPGQTVGQDVKSFGGEWYLITPMGGKAEAG